MKCGICGGAAKCPEGRYIDVLEAKVSHVHRTGGDRGPYCSLDEPCEGYQNAQAKGHRTKLLEEPPEGYKTVKTGSAQTTRIRKHYDTPGTWVSQCTYAFYVKETG